VVFPIEPGCIEHAVAAARTFNVMGASVTIPHKEAVVAFCDELSPEAVALDAVNTLQFLGGKVIGHNTDGPGFLASLGEELQFDVSGSRCVVLGAGGAAKAVVASLAAAGAEQITVVNRSEERGAGTAALGGARGRVGGVDDVAGADLIVNATPVGMQGEFEGQSPLAVEHLRSGQVVADLIYRPARTPLLEMAAAAGARTMNGTGMLLHQAALQVELWTGRKPPVEVMRNAMMRSL
jgi:shikimate dehydrogenase